MPRLIDADIVVTIQTYDDEHEEYDTETMTIKDALDRWADEGCPPTIDAEPVRHGRWIYKPDGWYCSACDKRAMVDAVGFAKYCCRCGALLTEVLECDYQD